MQYQIIRSCALMETCEGPQRVESAPPRTRTIGHKRALRRKERRAHEKGSTEVHLIRILKYFVLMLVLAHSSIWAVPVRDCTGTPADAVTKLPMPLAVWGKITCTPFGHVIEANDGWIWSSPGAYSPVFMPSQIVRANPEEVGNKSYFTKISLTKVTDDASRTAYEAFNKGFGTDEISPVRYRLDLTSVSGKTITQYFFDYGNSIWDYGAMTAAIQLANSCC